MEYCKRCCYPKNARPTIIFDEQGVCSGCRVTEQRPHIDWELRNERFREILTEYREKARANGSQYDCIIPVSGGKDSHYQVYIVKVVLGFNPLLVTYNHGFNTKRGIRNLTNMVKQFDCDLLRFTTNPEAARNISRYMLKKVGDLTWHYHAGIMTFPIRCAVQYRIPLVVWGDHGYADMLGMYSYDDMVEFSKKLRREHFMRGFEPEDILSDPENTNITPAHLAPFFYPSDEEIEALGVRGIYVSNFFNWDQYKHTKFVIDHYNFETALSRERTHHLYDKLDDIHANGAHDYLKYLKFGYGRATDDASNDIRNGRLTREEGIEMVKKHDHIRPSDLDIWLKFVGMTQDEFLASIDHLRDPQMWERDGNGEWQVKDSIANHMHDPGVDIHRLPLVKEREVLMSHNQPVSDPRHSHLQSDVAGHDHIPEDTEYVWL